MLLEFRSMGGFRYALYTMTGAIMAFLILPILFIIALSFGSSRWLQFPPPEWTLRWYRELFERSDWLDAIITSLQVGACVTALSLLLGVPAAFAVVRGRFPGRDLLNAFFTTPLIVPLVIIGIAIYGLYLSWGLAGTFIGFVMGHLILAIPFAVITTSNALRSFDENIEKAAIVCGATRAQALWRVTLPGIRSGIIAGGLFSFLISWDEVVLAIFMSSSSVQTLPVKMWSALRLDLSPIIAAAASLLVLLTVILLALIAFVQHYEAARAQRREEG